MKRILCVLAFLCVSGLLSAQNAYIQVLGEPDLSVFLDGAFKGKTTAEFNGLIIENVVPGTHTIKVVKEGYVPFEEKITVKAGEVMAYKVKPFSKHTITITEEGRSEDSDKKAEVKTGTLVVQSVPIEIRISIDEVDGARDIGKTKDLWTANDIPEGYYLLHFSFGDRKASQEVQIVGNETTKVFVNLLSNQITVTYSHLEFQELRSYCDSLVVLYPYALGLSREEFLRQDPAFYSTVMKSSYVSDNNMFGFPATSYFRDVDHYQKGKRNKWIFLEGFSGYIVNNSNLVVSCSWNLLAEKHDLKFKEERYAAIVADIQNKLPSKYWRLLNDSKHGSPVERIIITFPDQSGNPLFYITFKLIRTIETILVLDYSSELVFAEW